MGRPGLPSQNISSLSHTGHRCVSVDPGAGLVQSRPSANICGLSAGMRSALGQRHHRPATSRPTASFRSLMPQTECDLYPPWVNKQTNKHLSLSTPRGGKARAGLWRAPGPRPEALCKYHQPGLSGDTGKGQGKLLFLAD